MKSNIKKVHHCEICKKTFTSTYKLKSHLFNHKAIAARFKCTYCLKEYFRKDEYTRHMAVHTNQQKLHVCDHCGRGFVDKRSLVKHLLIHDDLHVASKRYNCIACDVSYCEERLLIYHIRKHHMNLDTKVPIYTRKNLNDSWIESAMDSKSCVQITKVTNNMLSIKKCKSKLKVEKCETDKKVKREADKSLTKLNKNILGINRHQYFIQDDADKALKQYLASVFALKNNLYSKAICDYCNKEMLKKSLIVHIRERHSKIRRFHCLNCKRSFNRPYQQSEHICSKLRQTKNRRISVKNQRTKT